MKEIRLILILAMFVLAMAHAAMAQTSAPIKGATDWLDDYREALRLELVEGDLQSAAEAYRRVLVSSAPSAYNQRAKYRFASTLRRLGRTDEARQILERLLSELGSGGNLRRKVARELEQTNTGPSVRSTFWQTELTRALSAGDLARTKEAAEFLAYGEDLDGLQTLLESYDAVSEEHPARAILLVYLGLSGYPPAVSRLQAGLGDVDSDVVQASVRGLTELGDGSSVEDIIGLIHHPDSDVRLAVLRAIERFRRLPAIEMLISAANEDDDEQVKALARCILKSLGTPRALRAVELLLLEAPEVDCSLEAFGPQDSCNYSEWYREHVQPQHEPQHDISARSNRSTASSAPLVGYVISAMSHHAPVCSGTRATYIQQLRQAWVLQRAGFELAILAEPEVLVDPAFADMKKLLHPPVKVYSLGEWPDCDAMVMNEVLHVPLALVQTVDAYVRRGGQLVTCGAVAGGFCGDGLSWRGLTQIRRLHVHRFESEHCRLIWEAAGQSLSSGLTDPNGQVWTAPRRGSFYPGEPLGGEVLARFEEPQTWAIKQQSVDRGRVVSFNWSVGLRRTELTDEDSLFCRVMDRVIDPHRETVSPHFQILHHRRWGRWVQAKQTLTSDNLRSQSPMRQREILQQMCNVFALENNYPAGLRRAQAISGSATGEPSDEPRVAEGPPPPRMQMALATNGFLWRVDVPDWLRPNLESLKSDQIRWNTALPLWLIGPTELPAQVWVRIGIPTGREGFVQMDVSGATLTEIPELQSDQFKVETESDSGRIDVPFDRWASADGWIELLLDMKEWNATLKCRVAVQEADSHSRSD